MNDDYDQWSDYAELQQITADTNLFKQYQQEAVSPDDDDYTQNSTDVFPWSFSYPHWVDEDSEAWRKVWDIDYESIDVAQRAADFYILMGIVNKAFSSKYDDLTLPSLEEIRQAGELLGKESNEIDERISHLDAYAKSRPENRLTELTSEAEWIYTDLVLRLGKTFRDYTHAACGGELRHHKAVSCLSAVRRRSWAKWYFIYEQFGNQALVTMKELFLEFNASAFGGEAWANAAEILYMYETAEFSKDPIMNNALFIDRIFNLEHNTGCFLNKLSWVNLRTDREHPYKIHYTKMKDNVLAAHASNPVDLNMLYGFASEPIQDLCARYMDAIMDFGYPILCSWGQNPTAKTGIYGAKSRGPKKEIKPMIDWSGDLEGSQQKSAADNPALDKVKALLGDDHV